MDNQTKKKIALIEDDNLIRDLYQGELERVGYEVASFGNGTDGLNYLKQNPADLVLLDIMLPDTNGLEILKELKSDPNNQSLQSLKVVLLTNLGQDTVIKEGFQLGAIGYLIKAAYNPEQVINEVKNFLENPTTPPNTAV